MNIAQFRLDFPQFTDVVKYPDAQITFWATLAENQLVAARWGDILLYATELYTAHSVVLASDGKIGKQTGITSSKSVGDVSVGYDTGSSIELNAGHWNLTNYGRQFIRLARMYGAGCIQL